MLGVRVSSISRDGSTAGRSVTQAVMRCAPSGGSAREVGMARVGTTAVVALIACALIGAGCGSDESSDSNVPVSALSVVTTTTMAASSSTSSTESSASPASAPPPAQSTAPSTTFASSAGSSPVTIPAGEGPEAACTSGERPLVFAYEQTSGALRWARCTSEPVVPMIAGATEQLVYAVLTKD